MILIYNKHIKRVIVMNFGLLLLLLALLLISIVVFSKKLNKRLYFIVILIVVAVSTIGICSVKPQIHNQFQISIIDYIFKFDNSKGD